MFSAPDGSYSLKLPENWTAQIIEGVPLLMAKSGVGTLRISSWRTTRWSGGVNRFLAKQEANLVAPVDIEKKVLTMKRINPPGKKGLLRISLAEEENTPVMILMYILGGKTAVMLATYSIAFVSYGTPEGKSEVENVIAMLNRATIR